MIKRVSEKDFEKYSSFIENHENGHFMQTLSWARFKSSQQSFAIMCEDGGGNVVGTMLMFLQKVRRTNKVFLYCPRGPVCERGDAKVLSELLSGAEAIAKEVGAYKLTLDPDIAKNDTAWISYFSEMGARVGENAVDNAILQPFSVYRINVDKSDDELMESYHSKARYSVRVSIKSKAKCRLGTRADIPTFCSLLEATAEKDNFTARSEKYFYDMYDALGDDMMKIFIVECEGRAIAGSVLIKCARKTWHMYAGSNDECKETLPNFLMQWEMMRWSRDNGCPLYDMRGIAGAADKLRPIEGLVRFKKRFGGELCSFVGRIDIVYDRFSDSAVRAFGAACRIVRKITGRK